MKYFISGHIDVEQDFFDKYYVPVLERVIEKEVHPRFIVGDCNGIDKMAQIWLKENGMEENTTVYHMFDKPRNLEGSFKTIGGFKSDVERDTVMTKDSMKDIAFIMPGRWNSGTAQNILRRHEIQD